MTTTASAPAATVVAEAATGAPPRRRRRTDRGRRTRAIVYLVLAGVLCVWIVPFVWMALGSVKTQGEILQRPPTWWPQDPVADNFAQWFGPLDFGTFFSNSLVVALVTVLGNLVFCSMAGYALAKMRFPLAPAVFGWMVACIMIPFYATVIPVFLMVRHMPLFGGNTILGAGGTGWIDTWWALIVPGAISPFMVFLFRQFYVATPTELIEAARLDGVGEFGIYTRIVTPLIKPGLLTVALLSFEAGWNNFLWPLLVTTSDSLRVIQVGISSFRQEAATDWHLLMAGTTLAAVPMIILFLVFQRYFVEGFAASGIK